MELIPVAVGGKLGQACPKLLEAVVLGGVSWLVHRFKHLKLKVAALRPLYRGG